MNLSPVLSLLSVVGAVSAMDMSDSSSSSGSLTAMMILYLHFTRGDYLYFAGVAPTSGGAIAGACILLVILAIFERTIAGARGIFALALAERKRRSVQEPIQSTTETPQEGKNTGDITSSPESTFCATPPSGLRPLSAQRRKIMGPFLWTHEMAHGGLFVIQSFFLYALMLGVMTFNAGYIISIIAGSAIGEVLFGRFIVESRH